MKYLFVFIFSLSMLFVNAQAKVDSGLNEIRNLQAINPTLQSGFILTSYNAGSSDEIKGSVYLYDEWFNNSAVYFENSDRPVVLPRFNLNLQSEQFEYMYAKDSIFSVNSAQLDKVVMRSKTFKKYLDPDAKMLAFFEEIYNSGNMSLVKKYILDVSEGQVNHMTGNKLNPDSYIIKEKYYIHEGEDSEVLKEIKLNKRLVYSLVEEENYAKIKKYARDHNLSFHDELDVRYILIYSQSI